MPEDKAGFVLSPHSIPTPKQHMVLPDRWLPATAIVLIKAYLQWHVQISPRKQNKVSLQLTDRDEQ